MAPRRINLRSVNGRSAHIHACIHELQTMSSVVTEKRSREGGRDNEMDDGPSGLLETKEAAAAASSLNRAISH